MKAYRYIAVGGFVGATMRYFISEQLMAIQPIATLLINIAGSFLISLLYSVVTVKIRWHEEIRWAFGTGLLGAFTTFSTFSVDMLRYVEQGQYGAALLYMLGNVVGGGIAAMIAILVVEKCRKRRVAT